MATISLSSTMVILPYEGGNQDITVTVSGATFTSYSVNSPQITFTRQGNNINLSIGQNPNTNTERFWSPVLTINASDGTSESFQLYIFQKGSNLTVADSAREKTLQSNESSVYYYLISEVEYNSVQIARLTGDVVITNTSYTQDSGGGIRAYVYTADNTSSAVQTAIIRVTGVKQDTSSETAYLLLHKNGSPGSITLTPDSVIVSKSAGNYTFNTSIVDVASPETHYTAMSGTTTVSSATLRNNNSELYVVYGENNSGNRIENIVSVNGLDSYGYTRSDGSSLIQLGADPAIIIAPNSRTLASNESTAYYYVTLTEVTNPSVSISGTVSVDRYTFEPFNDGYALYVYTNDNTGTAQQSSTITITGASILGGTVTATATLLKNGIPGEIEITPATLEVYGSTTTATFNVNTTQMDLTTLGYNTWGDMTFNSVAYNNDKTQITATFAENTGSAPIVGYLSVYGNDLNGYAHNDSTTITQLSKPSISFRTPNVTVQSSSTGYVAFLDVINCSNLMVSHSGTVNITSANLSVESGEQVLRIAFTANETTSSKQSTITVTGTGNDGLTYTGTATLTQYGESLLILTPSSTTVFKDAGRLTFTITSQNIDTDTIEFYGVGPAGSINFTNWDINANKTELWVEYGANDTGSDLTGTIRIYGEDLDSNEYTANASITQKGVGSSMIINPNSRTLTATETTAMYVVTVDGLTNLTATATGSVNVTNTSFTEVTAGSVYRLYVTTGDNTGTTQQTSTITVSGVNAINETVSQTATLIKNGRSGSITITPTSKTVTKAAGSASFNVTLDNMNLRTIVSNPYLGSTMDFTAVDLNESLTVLTVEWNANDTGNDLWGIFTVIGEDNNGDYQSASVNITQLGADSGITISPNSRTLGATEMSVMYVVSHPNISNITASFSGTVSIASYSFSDPNLYIQTNDNTSNVDQQSTVTVSGVDSLGDEYSGTATLIKKAAGGSVVVTPTSQNVTYDAGTVTYSVSSTNIVGDLTVTTSGEMSITSATLSGDTLTVIYAANSGYTTKTSYFVVGGTDTNGNRQSATVSLTQDHPPVTGIITLTPSTRTINAAAGSTTFTVSTSDMDTSTLTVSNSGSVNITSCTLSSDKRTVNITYGANSSTTTAKTSTITVSGDDLGGTARSGSATLSQAKYTPTSYTFEFNPSSQSSKTIGTSPTTVRYTIDSFKNSGSSVGLGYDVDGISYTGTWPTNINTLYDNGIPYFIVPANIRTTQRTATIIFVQEESGLTLTATIIQNGGSSTTENFLPIWRDDVYSASADDFIEYHISVDGNIIYAGKAYKYPDASNIEWTINDVCSNYIGTGITFTEGIQQIPNYCKVFSVVTSQNTLRRSRFYNSWAYEDTDYWLSDPIDYRVDPRQWLPVSFLSSNSRNITVGGTSYTASSLNDGWTVMKNLNNLTLNCGGTFTVTPGIGRARNYIVDCGDFALYYANAYGGWDALIVKGTTKKTDNIEHMNYRRKSSSLSDFSKVNYQNNITPTWSLNTGITINGHKMYHLLESTMVYLHNLNTNEIVPVVITNAQCEYLDYTNNGKKPYYYNITVEESNLKLRK